MKKYIHTHRRSDDDDDDDDDNNNVMQGLKEKLFLVLCITKGKKRTRLHLFFSTIHKIEKKRTDRKKISIYIYMYFSLDAYRSMHTSVQFFSYLVVFMTHIFLFLADAQGVGKRESKRINVN
jgi:hypothetical protein